MKMHETSQAKIRAIHIKTLFLQKGITQRAVAKRVNVSPSFLSQLIAGKKRSKAKEIALCKFLGISRDVLWS